MVQPIIAVVCDFDGTLGPDMASYLLQEHNIDPQPFWTRITKMVERKRWDPVQAYLHVILEYVKIGKIESLTAGDLQKIGAKLKLYPGVPDIFRGLRTYVQNSRKLKDVGIQLKYYIISGGLEEMIRGTKVTRYMDGIFACNFHYDEDSGNACAIKSAISFTEKTRILYSIHKGYSEDEIRTKPYLVNSVMPWNDRPVPLSSMIYIGDGPSDIPCMSMIVQGKGHCIGVIPPEGSFVKGYELAIGGRTTLGPYSTNYTKQSDMRKMIEVTLDAVGAEIKVELRKGVRPPPQH